MITCKDCIYSKGTSGCVILGIEPKDDFFCQSGTDIYGDTNREQEDTDDRT